MIPVSYRTSLSDSGKKFLEKHASRPKKKEILRKLNFQKEVTLLTSVKRDFERHVPRVLCATLIKGSLEQASKMFVLEAVPHDSG